MKKSLKAILLFFAATVVLTSCSDDDNPPTAGFSFSTTEVTQWDKVDVISSAEKADDVEYNVSGGSFEKDGNTIQFLEAKTYTVTQSATNGDGTDTMSQDIVVTAPDNKYNIAGTDLPLTDLPVWQPADEAHGTKALLKFVSDVSGQDNPNHIKISPILGTNPLEGTYAYNADGETVGSYYLRVIANYPGGFNPSDWTTDFSGSDGGSDLVIELVYEDSADANNNVYDIKVDSYTISAGYYDMAAGFVFVEVEKKSFSIQYRGVVNPAAV